MYLVISCWYSVFQFSNEPDPDFGGIVPLELVLNKTHIHLQLNLDNKTYK